MLTPFRVDFDDGVIADIRARLRGATLPRPRGQGWEHGASIDYLEQFRRYWIDHYDWAAAQERLNAHPQFITTIEGLEVHFYWMRGSGPNPRPLLLTHGWPGSVVEFLHVIDALARPDSYGGDAGDSFDVVVPSLPGFGFSGRPASVLGPRSTARLWRRLMTEVLGYDRFVAQGGDLGSMVTAYLGGDHADVVSAIHLNFVPIRPLPDNELTPEEREWKTEADEYRARELDYFTLQEHRPQTLAVALQDSPLGAGAWMLERLNSWSDGGVAHAFRIDDLITNLLLYIATGRIESSLWFYRSFLLECEGRTHPAARVEVPTGVAVFPKEMLNGRPPRSWAERDYELVHWSVMPRGGHFACFEQPELFVGDVRKFFSEQLDPRTVALPLVATAEVAQCTDVGEFLRSERYPLSSRYDADWILDLDMGPHPLWQLEDLLHDLELAAGMHVLDLGSGKGATSVFLARECGVSVVACDLWIAAAEAEAVFDAAGVSAQVSAVNADARHLPFGESEFDAIVSIDAFEYFGTDVHLLPSLLKVLKPGGWIGVSTPALRDDPYEAGIPAYVAEVVGYEAAAWHAPEWWQRHWELSGAVQNVKTRWQDGGRDNWLQWARANLRKRGGPDVVVEMLERDVAEKIGFTLISAQRQAIG